MAQQLTIEQSSESDFTVLAVAGEIDLATAPQLETQVANVDPTGKVMIDLSEVTFMDSTGLRVLISAHERASDGGGKLAIVAGEGAVTKLLAITGVDGWLNVYDSRSSATDDA